MFPQTAHVESIALFEKRGVPWKRRAPLRYLRVSIPRQELNLIEAGQAVRTWPVSTAENGPGERMGSGCAARMASHSRQDRRGTRSARCSKAPSDRRNLRCRTEAQFQIETGYSPEFSGWAAWSRVSTAMGGGYDVALYLHTRKSRCRRQWNPGLPRLHPHEEFRRGRFIRAGGGEPVLIESQRKGSLFHFHSKVSFVGGISVVIHTAHPCAVPGRRACQSAVLPIGHTVSMYRPLRAPRVPISCLPMGPALVSIQNAGNGFALSRPTMKDVR